SVGLAFVFGYSFTMVPLLRSGLAIGVVLKLALAADTASIALMEVVDNLIMLVIPGAMDAHLGAPLFWGSLALSLVLAGAAAYPLNRWLISRGRGHAVVHEHHAH
ncbi:membrane protein, partial [Streptomyces coelicoflavus ZG0656]